MIAFIVYYYVVSQIFIGYLSELSQIVGRFFKQMAHLNTIQSDASNIMCPNSSTTPILDSTLQFTYKKKVSAFIINQNSFINR